MLTKYMHLQTTECLETNLFNYLSSAEVSLYLEARQ